MGFALKGQATVKPVEFELVHQTGKNSGNIWLRAIDGRGKKHRVLSLANGATGSIVFHPGCQNLGFGTDMAGYVNTTRAAARPRTNRR